MSSLLVRTYQGTAPNPSKTIRVPGGLLKFARKFVPARAVSALRDEGIDLDELVRLSEQPEVVGTLVEIDDHEKNERVVISLE